MEFVDSSSCLGHWLYMNEDDGLDISVLIRLLCAQTNYLIRCFSKCSVLKYHYSFLFIYVFRVIWAVAWYKYKYKIYNII